METIFKICPGLAFPLIPTGRLAPDWGDASRSNVVTFQKQAGSYGAESILIKWVHDHYHRF